MYNVNDAIGTDPKLLLKESDWIERSRLHIARIAAVTDPWLEKRSRQQKDPVLDFLFEYYPFRVSHIKRWSPGIGVKLEHSGTHPLPAGIELTVDGDVAYLDPLNLTEKRIRSFRWILELLEQSARRKPHFGCFGMHEWAMVYRAQEIRHDQIPLRLPADEIARFVESRPLLCTHYDAYRFFTEPAQPMNRHSLNRNSFTDMEQSGCIHTNMDLYKWTFKLSPWIESELIADTFLNAVEARRTDMRASPYDARAFGLEPIPIETEEGRREYLKKQMEIHDRSAPLRKRLILACRDILRQASFL
ncbi:MAG: 3-methyladenine DNA glycosylase [Balneolaceae bacterium]|nr:MAG: 3-methyladenine DNA glycosylase [Balneolaceae bacterium]